MIVEMETSSNTFSSLVERKRKKGKKNKKNKKKKKNRKKRRRKQISKSDPFTQDTDSLIRVGFMRRTRKANPGYHLNYWGRWYRRRHAVGFKILFLDFNPLVNLIINNKKYFGKGWYRATDNWYHWHYISHEYKQFLQYMFEDWLCMDLPIPVKLMKVQVLVRYPLEKFRIDAHPHPNWSAAEIRDKRKKEELKKKSKSKSQKIDDEALPGNMMDYKYVDLFDGYVKYKPYKAFGEELVPQHKIEGKGGYKPYLGKYSFFQSRMPQSYVNTRGGNSMFKHYYIDPELFKYYNRKCWKMNHCHYHLNIEPAEVYTPNANIYPRTYGTLKFKMKGQAGQAFDYQIRGVKDIRVWTVKRMDIIIKSKTLKHNNVPYCVVDGDPGFRSPFKYLYGAPCTTVASLGDGREHFIHKNSVGLFTRDGFRLINNKRARTNYTYLVRGGFTLVDNVSVPWSTYMGFLALERKWQLCRVIYFLGDEFVACFHEDTPDYHDCLEIDKNYEYNYMVPKEATLSTSDEAPMVDNAADNIFVPGKTLYFKAYQASCNLSINFTMRENFYFTNIYIKFKSAPKQLSITCHYQNPGRRGLAHSTIVYSNMDNNSKVINSSLLVSPCKQMTLQFDGLDPVLSKVQSFMQIAIKEIKLYSDAKPIYWRTCRKDQETQLWFQDVYRHSSTPKIVKAIINYAAGKLTYDQAFTKFTPRLNTLQMYKSLSAGLKAQAYSDNRSIDKSTRTIKVINKKIDYLRNLFSGGSAGTADSGIGYSSRNPALSCEELAALYGRPANGFYWIITMCTKRAQRVFCDFKNGNRLIYLSNLNSALNTWLEKSNHAIDEQHEFYKVCGHHGLYPWALTKATEIQTLAMVAKEYMVAYYTDGGIPIAIKRPTEPPKVGKFFSLDNATEIQVELDKFAAMTGQPFNVTPAVDTVFLSDSQLKTGIFGEGTKTFAIPCSLTARRIMRLDCKSKMDVLKIMPTASQWIACPKMCYNSVYGNRTYSQDSYICAAMLHSDNFIKKGAIYFSEIQVNPTFLYEFESGVNPKYALYSASKTYKTKQMNFSFNIPEETCATDIYLARERLKFVQLVQHVYKRFNPTLFLQKNMKALKTLKSMKLGKMLVRKAKLMKTMARSKSKKMKGELDDLASMDLVDQSLDLSVLNNNMNMGSHMHPIRSDSAALNVLSASASAGVPHPSSTDNSKDASEYKYNSMATEYSAEDSPFSFHHLIKPLQDFEPTFENKSDSASASNKIGKHEYSDVNANTHLIATKDYTITVTNHSGDNQAAGMQADLDHYFEFIKSTYFTKTHVNSETRTNSLKLKELAAYTPRVDVPMALEQVWSILSRYPHLTEKFNLAKIIMSSHISAQLQKTLSARDFKQYKTVAKYIRTLVTSKAILQAREDQEERERSAQQKFLNKHTQFREVRHSGQDDSIQEMSNLLTEDKTSADYFAKWQRFKALFQSQLKYDSDDSSSNENLNFNFNFNFKRKNAQNNESNEKDKDKDKDKTQAAIYDMMRFNFTSILDNDDDRSDKYYSNEQRLIITHMKNYEYLELRKQIEKSIKYVLLTYDLDSMSFKYLTSIFDEVHKKHMTDLDEEEYFRGPKFEKQAIQNSNDVLSIDPSLTIINRLALSFKNELKLKYVFNYDFYMGIFKYFNYFFEASLIGNYEPLERDFDYQDVLGSSDAPSSWMNTKKNTAPHAKAVTQKGSINYPGHAFSTVLYTRYREGFEYFYVNSFRANGGVVGVTWKYVDIYNYYAFEFDFDSAKSVNFIWNFNDERTVVRTKDIMLEINVWYFTIISTLGNRIKFYLVKEENFTDKEMTSAEIESYVKGHEPFLDVFHDALKNGAIGFYCNNCFGAYFDNIHIVHQQCLKAEDTAIMTLSSQFSDRYLEPYPGRDATKVYVALDNMEASKRPSKWVFVKGLYGTVKSLAQMKQTWISNKEHPASTLLKERIQCRDYCEYQLNFNPHNYNGSLTFGVKAVNSKTYIGVTIVVKKNQSVFVLQNIKEGKTINRKTSESKFKIRTGNWYTLKVSMVRDNIGVFLKSNSSNFEIIFYEQMKSSYNQKGSYLIGTNYLLVNFDQIRLKKIFVEENKQAALVKGLNDAKTKEFRFKMQNGNRIQNKFKSRKGDAIEQDAAQDEQDEQEEEKSQVLKSLSSPLMRVEELPTALVGINGGMLKSNYDSLSADNKLMAEQCLKLTSHTSRRGYCESFSAEPDYCQAHFCPSCCRMSLPANDPEIQHCTAICHSIQVYDDVTQATAECVSPADPYYTLNFVCRDRHLCNVAVCQSCCENIKNFKNISRTDLQSCKAQCLYKFPVDTEKSMNFETHDYGKEFNPLKTIKVANLNWE